MVDGAASGPERLRGSSQPHSTDQRNNRPPCLPTTSQDVHPPPLSDFYTTCIYLGSLCDCPVHLFPSKHRLFAPLDAFGAGRRETHRTRYQATAPLKRRSLHLVEPVQSWTCCARDIRHWALRNVWHSYRRLVCTVSLSLHHRRHPAHLPTRSASGLVTSPASSSYAIIQRRRAPRRRYARRGQTQQAGAQEAEEEGRQTKS